jgi:transcriptional regulatory protein RtcR
LQYELERFAARNGRKVTMNKEARERFLQFAESPAARWSANFRDLNAAVTRMATLAHGGRITADDVAQEIGRLQAGWCGPAAGSSDVAELQHVLTADRLASLDLFDQAQLATVVRVCRESKSLSEAGRTLFAVSRRSKAQPNDADRLRKYLARFGLAWTQVSG